MTSDKSGYIEAFVWIWLPGATAPVVAAAVSDGYAVLARLLFRNGLVAQAGQSVILEHDAEFRLARSVFRDEGRGNARGSFAGDGETVVFQQVIEITGQLDFEEGDFGQVPKYQNRRFQGPFLGFS